MQGLGVEDMEEQKKTSLFMSIKNRYEKVHNKDMSNQRGIFYKAFVSGDRLQGKCSLSVVWRLGKEKKYQVQRYDLAFGQVGITDYLEAEIPCLPGKRLKNCIFPHSVEVSLLEAAALLQDAYETSMLSKCPLPAELNISDSLFAYNTADLDRALLLSKISAGPMDEEGFVNVYAAAMRREDSFLMYDLSSPERQQILGVRNRSLFNNIGISGASLVLKSQVRCADEKLRDIFTLEAYLSTRDDQIQRVLYLIKITISKGEFLIDSVKEIERCPVDKNDPRNPLDYHISCSLYRLRENKGLENWLQSHPDLFLSGEFAYGASYKWIIDGDNTYTDFNITNSILGEVILTNNQVLIFSQRSENLLKLEKEILPVVKKQITGMRKFQLSIAELYRAMLVPQEVDY